MSKVLQMFKMSLLILAIVALPLVTFAQNTATGVVVDEKDGPIPGVTVQVKGTTQGTITDLDGKYSLKVADNAVLVYKFVGYETIEVNVVPGQSVYNVKMKAQDQAINEVVVVGYGTVKKSDLTGSVSSVKTEQLKQTSTMDVAKALEGRVAGVSVTASDGAPGSSMKVRVRGVGSLNNSDPLYVVDGFPTQNLSHISPSDIESMEVMKDASSTAIYGSRGANGVIMITTKKGKSGETHVTFNSFMGVQTPWRTLKMCNAQQYATLVQEAYTNSGTTMDEFTKSTTDYVLAHPESVGTDWQKEVYNERSVVKNYSLNITGGTDKSRYNLSATYSGDDGLIKNSSLNKYIISFANDYKFSDRIKANVSINYVNSHKKKYNSDIYTGVLPVALQNSPLVPAVDSNTGTWGDDKFAKVSNAALNADLNQYLNWYESRVVGNTGVTVDLTKNISFRSQFGLDLNSTQDRDFIPIYHVSSEIFNDRSSLAETRTSQVEWTWSNYVQFQKSISGGHDVTAMIGTEANRQQYDKINVKTFDVAQDEQLRYISQSTSRLSSAANSEQSDLRLLSFYGRLNYSFQNKYMLSFITRRDGSSKFTQENRWGIFPSASVAWNVKNESFMKDLNAISSLKLRLGWGKVGNQAAADNAATIVPVSAGKSYVFGSTQTQAVGVMSERLGNTNLKWEATETKNLGVDASFFNGKIDVTADYFVKQTNDMILQVPIPNFTGAGNPYVNAGNMSNKGVEFSINHRNEVAGLKYDVGYNMSFIRNKVIDLGGAAPIAGGNVGGHLSSTTLTEVGQEMAYFYGYKTDGIFHSEAEAAAYKNDKGELMQPLAKAGDVKWVDVNGDGKINESDRTKIGTWQPKFSYGFNLSLNYMNFDFKMFLQGVYGCQIVNAMDRFIASTSPLGGMMANMLSSRFDDRWSSSNPNNNGPRVARSDDNQNYTRFSDLYIEDGSYLRLKNIQLGYTIPSALTSKVKIKSLRIYISADNLLTFTKYKGMEPVVSGTTSFNQNVDMATYPHARILMGGLNLNF